MLYRLYFFVFIYLLSTTGWAADLVIATFNSEFLTKPRVHIKFGYKFNLKNESQEVRDQWTPAYRTAKFLEAIIAVVKVIKQTKADIIILTEVGNKKDVTILKNELKKIQVDYPFIAVGKSAPQDQTKQHVAILSKYKLSKITRQLVGRESYLQEADDPNSEQDTGVSKSIRAQVSVGDYSLIIYGLHLSSERGGHEKDQQRIAQASIVRRYILNDFDNKRHVVVAGDLNDGRGQPAIRRIRGMDDVFADLIQTGLSQYFLETELATRWTYEYLGERNQIDHLLLSYSFKNITKRGGIKSKTIDHGNKLASDHRPFIVTLKLK